METSNKLKRVEPTIDSTIVDYSSNSSYLDSSGNQTIEKSPRMSPPKRRPLTEARKRTTSNELRRSLSSSSDNRLRRGLSFPSSPLSSLRNSAHKSEQHSRLYKVLVVGEVNTGKSAFVRRYVHNYFSEKCDYRATLGVDFQLKLIHFNDELEIRLQLWDIAGQERFCNMTRAYYKGAVGAFLVCDSSNAKTFDALTKWKKDLDTKCLTPDGQNIPCILIVNKSDLGKDPQFPCDDKISQFVRDNGFHLNWFRASAKSGLGIQDSTSQMVRQIMIIDSWSWPKYADNEADQSSDLSHVSDPNNSSHRSGKLVLQPVTKRGLLLRHKCGC